MTDKPIIFSAPMIRALLDGRKTQTRRILKPQPPEWVSKMTHEGRYGWIGAGDGHGTLMRLPYATGDRLWVREQHYLTDDGVAECVIYTADDDAVAQHHSDIARLQAQHGFSDEWAKPHLCIRPSIHMPRWASRLTLIVTDVRVQRLQDISGEDAVAEGVPSRLPTNGIAQAEFMDVWDRLHGSGARYLNPWVCALTFTVHNRNIDRMGAAE